MKLIDFNQTVVSNVMMEATRQKGPITLDIGIIRHFVLNSIRHYQTRFKKYGETIICCDSRHYWRTKLFQYYKSTRKAKKDDSKVNWNELYAILDALKAEISANFPYRIIEVDQAEADDIIATICYQFGASGPPELFTALPQQILIISGDKDFRQLQRFSNVEQYSPITKKVIKEDNPEKYLYEQIMQGDGGDGIPNFLSDDDTFDNISKRSVPLGETGIAKWAGKEATWTPEMHKRWARNNALINLNMIPKDIQDAIIKQLDEQTGKRNRSKLFAYFAEHRLTNLMPNIGDF